MAQQGSASAQAAVPDRKPPSTSTASAGILSLRHEPPIYLHRAVASSCPATPRSAELLATRHGKLSLRTCLLDKWNPSFRHKYRAATADTLRFRCARALNLHTPADDPASAHRVSACHQFRTPLVTVPAPHRHRAAPSASR